MKKKIMLMARDPGGANTVIPLAEVLEQRGYQVHLYGKDMALQCYQQRGLQGQDIRLFITDVSIEKWIDFLECEKPDFIITGTSGDDFSERFLWKAAEKIGIKTFAILDQWMNYGIRFSPYIPREQEQYRFNRIHSYLPDHILVMDNWARQAMINEGIEPARILISGQPHFDFLLSQRENISKVRIADFRRELGLKEEDFLITYISEPLSKDYRIANSQDDYYWGYDEQSICRQLLSALYEVNKAANTKISLVIKQHPREDEGSYTLLEREFSSELINIKVLKEVDAQSLLLASDLVCGISSMLLLEAILYSCPVISIQIGLNRETPLILAQQGILEPIREKEELNKVLQGVLLEHYIPAVKWQMEAGAVNRVIEFMEEF